MNKLWSSNGPVSFHGKFFHAEGAILEPSPIQKGRPQIWMGGQSPYVVKLAGRLAEGWIPSGPRWYSDNYIRPEEYSQKVEVIKKELEKRRFDPVNFVFTILINRATDLKTMTQEISDYAKAGMNYFILGEAGADDESRLADLEIVARDIMPAF